MNDWLFTKISQYEKRDLARTYVVVKIGIQAIEVDAINGQAKQFYQRYGFIPLEDDPNHLMLPMKVVRKLSLPPL